MATFFDIALLSNFSIIFTFLIVFAIVFAMLEFLKIFGDNKPIHAVIALSAAMVMIFSKGAVEVINFMVPWFMILVIVATFGIIGYKLFAGPGADLSILHQGTSLRSWVIAIVAIIFLIALAQTFGQDIGPYLGEPNVTQKEALDPGAVPSTATESFAENLTATLFHPRVLALVVIILIATFAIVFLAQKPI